MIVSAKVWCAYVIYVHICTVLACALRIFIYYVSKEKNINLFAVHLTLELVAMEVCFLTSGETLTVLEDELQGQTAKGSEESLGSQGWHFQIQATILS